MMPEGDTTDAAARLPVGMRLKTETCMQVRVYTPHVYMSTPLYGHHSGIQAPGIWCPDMIAGVTFPHYITDLREFT
jgi:hypothetical protein